MPTAPGRDPDWISSDESSPDAPVTVAPADPPSFWHGSLQPLPPGTKLLPKRARGLLDYEWVRQETAHLYDLDRVYFTADREYARAWVARARGALLRVQPHGALEPDSDTGPGGFSAPSATVLEVAECPVEMTTMQIRRAFAAQEPERYSPEGFIVPSGDFLSDMVAIGLTEDICRQFGRWANPHRICFYPETKTFEYITDDVELQVTAAVRESMLNGASLEEAFEVATSDESLDNVERYVMHRPNPWL